MITKLKWGKAAITTWKATSGRSQWFIERRGKDAWDLHGGPPSVALIMWKLRSLKEAKWTATALQMFFEVAKLTWAEQPGKGGAK